MSYFDAGIETSDIDVSRLIEKIIKKKKKDKQKFTQQR